MKLNLRWGDGLALGLGTALVAASFSLAYTPATDSARLVVVQAGGAPLHFSLGEERILRIDGPAGTTEVEIRGGRARCLRSPGSRGICERAGWLERPGDIAVSLPNRLVLQIEQDRPAYDSMHF